MVQEEREKCQRQLEVTRELVNTIAAQVHLYYYGVCCIGEFNCVFVWLGIAFSV